MTGGSDYLKALLNGIGVRTIDYGVYFNESDIFQQQ
jgi:hypothetical protein